MNSGIAALTFACLGLVSSCSLAPPADAEERGISEASAAGAGPEGSGEVRVYLGTQTRGESKGIYVATLNTETGVLSPPRLAVELANPGFLAIHPGGGFLYATTRIQTAAGSKGGVAALKVGTDGSLEVLNRQLSMGNGPCHVGVDATGRCVLVANYGSGSVAALGIDAAGALVESRSFHQHEGRSVDERRQRGPHAHSIFAAPGNAQAYAADLGIDKVMIYALDADRATLVPAGAASLPAGSGPRHLKFNADGSRVYVLNEMLRTVAVFDRDARSGALTLRQVLSTLPTGAPGEQMSCSEIQLHPGGRFVYAANRDLAQRGRDSIAVFAVNADGGLRLVEVEPAHIWIPRHFALDPSGRWLLVAGQRSNEISVFRVDPKTGELEFTGQKVGLPSPMCVLFAPG